MLFGAGTISVSYGCCPKAWSARNLEYSVHNQQWVAILNELECFF